MRPRRFAATVAVISLAYAIQSAAYETPSPLTLAVRLFAGAFLGVVVTLAASVWAMWAMGGTLEG